MSDFDPQEFGYLKAQVEQLLESNRINTATLETMSEAIHAIQLQLAEARGGWKLMLAMGGASSALGGLVTWAATHFKFGG